jgi:hypothetical protein
LSFPGRCRRARIRQDADLSQLYSPAQGSGGIGTSVRATEGTFKILTGEPTVYVKTAESGAKRVQAFCPRCGSPIYAAPAGAEPKTYNIRVGTARQRDQLVPRVQIWCRSAQRWLGDLDGIRKVEMQP